MSNKSYQKIHEACKALRRAGVDFESINEGSRLTIRHNGIVIDFWPITGRFIPVWKDRVRFKPTKGLRGVDDLLSYLGADK